MTTTKKNPLWRTLFLLYYFPIGLPLFLLVTILTTLLIILGCSIGLGDAASRYVGMAWSRVSLWLHLCPIEIRSREHLPRSGNYVVIANHQSAFDIFALYGYVPLPFKWVLKEGLRKLPLVGWACESAGFIFVDDTKPSSITQTMQEARGALSRGYSIFIFPEGSRTPTGRMHRFKKGAFLMASELDVPLLPISIDGAYDILQRGKLLPHPHNIRLTIHPAYRVSDLGEAPMNILYASREGASRIASVLPQEQEAKGVSL